MKRRKWFYLPIIVFLVLIALVVVSFEPVLSMFKDAATASTTSTAATTATIKDEPMATETGADTAESTTTTTETEETTTTAQGSSASSTTETEPTTTQKTTKATEKVTSTTATTTKATTKRTSPPTEAGHKHEYKAYVQPADCSRGGYTSHKCACGDFYVDNQTAKVDHKYDWKLVKASTETETGLKKYVCIYCGTSSREEVVPKKQNQPKIDSRVKIGTTKYTNNPLYTFGGIHVGDKRTWGERPEIVVGKNDSLQVTYLNQQGEKITFVVEQPSDDTYIYSAVINDDGTYSIRRSTAFS